MPTIELTCIIVGSEAEEETRAMWRQAAAIAKKFKIAKNFSFNADNGETYGDAYLYPSTAILEEVLLALDAADCNFDNIDLPADVDPTLVGRLRQKYPTGFGVMINLGDLQ